MPDNQIVISDLSKVYDNGFNEFHVIGSRNDYYPKGKRDLERFLNKNKAKYIGIDR